MLRILVFLVLGIVVLSCNSEEVNSRGGVQESQTEQISDSTDFKSEISNQNNTDRSRKEILDTIGSIIGVLYLIAIHVALFFLFIEYKKRENKIDKIRAAAKKDHQMRKRNEKELKRIINNFEKDNKDLKRNIDKLQSEKDELKSRRVKSDTEETSPQSKSLENLRKFAIKEDRSLDETLAENPNRKTRYFSIPNENGSFAVKRGAESSEGRMYYKVSYREGNSIGRIEYIEGHLDESAIDQRDSILKPVCYIQNSEISNPSTIVQVEPGIVKLKANEWMIDKKIKIKFK